MTPMHDATASRSQPFIRSLQLLAATIALVLFSTSVLAQSERSASSAEPAATVVPAQAAVANEGEGELRSPYGLVKPEDGTFLPLPPGTTYADFLEWLTARRGLGYGINSVEITGRVDEETTRIEFDAEIVVMVRRAEAVRVPLGFTEAVLIGVEHTGAGDASYEPSTEADGHVWSLQGQGEHRLKLKLLVPLSTQVDATHLTLTTPSDAATTTLGLVVPSGSEVTAADGIIRKTTEIETGGTSVEWVGTGGRIDLTWRPRPVSADPAALSASSMIFPSVSGKVVQLRAVVRVTAATGRISAVRLLLPDGFSVVDVTGKLVRTHTEETVGENRGVVVTLVEPTEGTIEITVRASAPLTADGRVVISGFSLPDVPTNAQTGMIVIEPSTAYRIDVADRTDGVERMEMVEPALADSQTFEFSSQPFRIDLQIDPIPPSLTVAPELVFQVSPDRLDLDARFAVSLLKGEVRELRLDWAASTWTIPRIGTGLIQEFRRGNGSNPPIDISIPAATPSFVIPVRANRPYEDDEIEIPIPRVVTPNVGATVEPLAPVICLRHSDSIAVEVDAADGLEPLMDSARAASLPKPAANERLVAFVAPPDVKSITLKVRRLSREVDVAAFVSIRPRGENLIVEERLDYDVRFDTLSELQVTVPKSLPVGEVEFIDGSGRVLASEVKETNADDVVVLLPLDRAVIGPFSISARYEVRPEVSPGATANVSVPLIFPAESAFDDVEVHISPLLHHTVALDGSSWTSLSTADNDGRDRWTASDVAEALSLRLSPRPVGEAKTTSIARMLFRTVIERDGTVRTVADCHLDDPPEILAIHFPSGIEPESFRWRGRSVSPEMVRDQSGVMAEIELHPGSDPPVLTVAYQESSDDPIGFVAGRRIGAIHFGNAASVEQTLWRITLPESQHLFSMPDGYEAGFRWGLHRGLWTRQTDESFQHIDDWFGSELPTLGPEFETGHQYTFSRTGAAVPLEITSLSRSLVVLLGAGMAIVLGYCFASGLISRRRPALIALGSILLILWAFFPSQVQIFLQPALFGLALVGAATIAEWALRKRQEQLASQSPSVVDFVTILPGDGSTSTPAASIGSEDPTVLRTARPSEIVGTHDSAYGPPVHPEPQPSARD